MPLSPPTSASRFGIIIPACDEAPAIALVLEELLRVADPEHFVIVVGVNGSSDETATIARRYPVLVAETVKRGYGYGCQAAIDLVETIAPDVVGYIFFAADGASDPRDLAVLIRAFEEGQTFVLGARTTSLANWPVMSLSHLIANFALASWCGLLAGRWFKDLAPLRLIERGLFHAIAPVEMTFGWTIEAQIAAVRLGARIREVAAHERHRLAGEQKVSGVTWRRTFLIGCRIVAAGWRTWRRGRRAPRVECAPRISAKQLLPQPQRGS
ncbi:MAG: glycosyltransferase [Verrucomicrobiota bacterium]|nr:glycosyltransferase [Verrucomicrobiota bacterium]